MWKITFWAFVAYITLATVLTYYGIPGRDVEEQAQLAFYSLFVP